MIVGNWKMHKTRAEAKAFVERLVSLGVSGAHLAVPFTALGSAVEAAGESVVIGAQNMHDAQEGAFTGEISARMLKECGAQFVLLGHSERRHVFGEANGFINRKVHRALGEGLMPILCIGETSVERAENRTEHVLERQLEECLQGVEASSAAHLVIAYEPVWAIGNGKHATPQQAEEVHQWVHEWLKKRFGAHGGNVRILYGGSVKPDNAKLLLQDPHVGGLLIGGASLDVESFVEIIRAKL